MTWNCNVALKIIVVLLTVAMCFSLMGCGDDNVDIINTEATTSDIIEEDVVESDEVAYDETIPDDVIADNIIGDEYLYECTINDDIVCDIVLIDIVVGETTEDEIREQLPEEYKDYDIDWPKVIGKYAVGTAIIVAVGFVDYATQGQAAIVCGTPITVGRDAFAGAVAGAAINTSINCAIDGKPTKQKLKKYAIEGSADGYMWGAIGSVTKNVIHKKKLVYDDGTKAKILKNGDVVDKADKVVGKAFAKGDKIYVSDKNGTVKAIFNSSGKQLSEASKTLPKDSVFQLSESSRKIYTDAKGFVYREGTQLKKNITYIKNGYKYSTDKYGRIKTFGTSNLKLKQGPRLSITDSQEAIAKGAQKAGDDRGHLFADMFGGDNSLANIVPMKGKLNKGEYKEMELIWKSALKEGKTVKVEGKLIYGDKTHRPDKIIVKYTIDNGDEITKVFAN